MGQGAREEFQQGTDILQIYEIDIFFVGGEGPADLSNRERGLLHHLRGIKILKVIQL